MGSDGEMFPNHVGSPIGENSDEDHYFILEIHYENPQELTFVHSPGMRVVYTDKLRPYDVNTLFLGQKVSHFMMIPPNQKRIKINGYCPSECTQKGFPPEGVFAATVLLHGHTYARSIILRHLRNGVELPPIAQDRTYDTNYQQYRQLQKEVKILPGDELMLECLFENESDDYIVGGLSSNREMCQALLLYYPKSSMVDCRSQYEFHSFFDSLGIEHVEGEMLKSLNLPYAPLENSVATPPDDGIVFFSLTGKEELNETLFDFLYSTGDEPGRKVKVSSVLKSRVWKSNDKTVDDWNRGGMYTHCAMSGGKRIELKMEKSIEK
ncbi:unnamed protein product [Allacma fusca]|uniref:Copper type II ascorbate-dependent monooxygenase C-terminal domain-containing protein n=1 Tax=Allacma fusca TaxID=39272 RepID=A0A8J2P5G9_9HEXA|nr:unnamed protein product [Allacma fusca]